MSQCTQFFFRYLGLLSWNGQALGRRLFKDTLSALKGNQLTLGKKTTCVEVFSQETTSRHACRHCCQVKLKDPTPPSIARLSSGLRDFLKCITLIFERLLVCCLLFFPWNLRVKATALFGAPLFFGWQNENSRSYHRNHWWKLSVFYLITEGVLFALKCIVHMTNLQVINIYWAMKL